MLKGETYVDIFLPTDRLDMTDQSNNVRARQPALSSPFSLSLSLDDGTFLLPLPRRVC